MKYFNDVVYFYSRFTSSQGRYHSFYIENRKLFSEKLAIFLIYDFIIGTHRKFVLFCCPIHIHYSKIVVGWIKKISVYQGQINPINYPESWYQIAFSFLPTLFLFFTFGLGH